MSHFWTIFEPIFERFAFGNSIWPVSKLSKKAADGRTDERTNERTNGRTDEHTSIFEAPLHNRPWRATSSHARRIVVPLATFCVSISYTTVEDREDANRWFWKAPNKHSRKREHFENIDYKTISDFGHFQILWLPGMVVPKLFFHRFSKTARSFLCCCNCQSFCHVFQSRK